MNDKNSFHSATGAMCSELTNPSSTRRQKILLCLLLAAITLGIFWQTGSHEFINFDDDLYVTDNFHVQNGLTWENVKWAFTTLHAGNWHPLTWLSHMTDVELFGMNPRGHHLNSVFIHTANTLLLFLILARITGSLLRSFMVAAIFALHPLHVESVAWVSERKDLLCGFFWFTGIGFYSSYARRSGILSYAAIAGCLVLGLMSKPMMVTFPFVLLLLDYWPLKRFQERTVSQLFLEKIPFFVISAGAAVATFVVQRKAGAVLSMTPGKALMLADNAVKSYLQYILKTFLPMDLSIIYPLLPHKINIGHFAVVLSIVLAISAIALLVGRREFVPVGWLWYLGTLVPVIGFVQAGAQAMADRYTYIPLTGLLIIIVWGAGDILKVLKMPVWVGSLAFAVVLTVCSAISVIQISYWKNTVTLFTHAVSVTENNWLAHSVLGSTHVREGRYREAYNHAVAALAVKKDDFASLMTIGIVFLKNHEYQKAVDVLTEASRNRPDDKAAQYLLHEARSQLNQMKL